MRRIALATVTALVLAGCGGSSGDDAEPTTDPPPESTPVDTTPTETAPPETSPPETSPPETSPPETAPPETAPADTTPPATTGDGQVSATSAVAVSLVEWEVIAPTEIPAGPTTFEVSNDGDFRHHFGIARGTSYEELPQLPSGAIDEEALGADFLGRTENIDFEGAATIEFDLAPGSYVLFCNIIAGPTSHAARGQTLSITVG